MRVLNFHISPSDKIDPDAFSGVHQVTNIDVLESPVASAKYNILDVPTILLVDAMGNELVRFIGRSEITTEFNNAAIQRLDERK